MLSTNRDSFVSSFNLFFLPKCPARTSSAVLNRSEENGLYSVFLILEGRLSVFHH
jgi:hypothetical protein